MTPKFPFPTCINYRKQQDLERAARRFIREFQGGVFPVLFKFDILDDQHVTKYIRCLSFQAIYEDILAEKPERLAYLESEANFEGKDFWGLFRDPDKMGLVGPDDPAFVFAGTPLCDFSLREQVISCISFEKGKFVIDHAGIEKLCVIHPTERQLAMFEILSDLCSRLKAEGFSKENISSLLFYDPKMKEMRVAVPDLLKNYFCFIKK